MSELVKLAPVVFFQQTDGNERRSHESNNVELPSDDDPVLIRRRVNDSVDDLLGSAVNQAVERASAAEPKVSAEGKEPAESRSARGGQRHAIGIDAVEIIQVYAPEHMPV